MITKAAFYKAGDVLEVTASGDVVAGDPIEVADGLSGIALHDAKSGDTLVVRVEGIIKIVADNSTGNVGVLVGWDADGSPVGGEASSGAATLTAASMDFTLGRLVGSNKGAGDGTIYVKLGRQFLTPAEAEAEYGTG